VAVHFSIQCLKQIQNEFTTLIYKIDISSDEDISIIVYSLSFHIHSLETEILKKVELFSVNISKDEILIDQRVQESLFLIRYFKFHLEKDVVMLVSRKY
jgi:hypothetical protein